MSMSTGENSDSFRATPRHGVFLLVSVPTLDDDASAAAVAAAAATAAATTATTAATDVAATTGAAPVKAS